ncbi:hypothetical protein SLA2020_336360 [Shorea laevis]
MAAWAMLMVAMLVTAVGSDAADTNGVYQPCADTKIQRSDGFTFGIAFSSKESFYYNQSHQLSPCDRRLSLASLTSQLALFRPKVDEISLLTINTTANFFPDSYVSLWPSSFRRVGCRICIGKEMDVLHAQANSNFVCLNKQDCAIKTSSCKGRGGTVDCSLGIQLAFSGTDKHLTALNSWYEVENLRQYSLYGLYSNLKNSLTSSYNSFF